MSYGQERPDPFIAEKSRALGLGLFPQGPTVRSPGHGSGEPPNTILSTQLLTQPPLIHPAFTLDGAGVRAAVPSVTWKEELEKVNTFIQVGKLSLRVNSMKRGEQQMEVRSSLVV